MDHLNVLLMKIAKTIRISVGIIAYFLVFSQIPIVEARSISVKAVDGSEAGTIEVRIIDGIEMLSLTEWSHLIDTELDWDYVTGVAEMQFRDHRLRFVDRGIGVWINGHMYSLPGPTLQKDGDLWIPVKILDDLVDPLWEGELIWNASENVLRLYSKGSHRHQDTDQGDRDGRLVIVLDAGHGGADSGCVTAGGISEKEVVLSLVVRVGDILSNRMGADVVLTRSSDTDQHCDDRIAEANRSAGDLFISFHTAPEEEMQGNSFALYLLPAGGETRDAGSQLELWETRSETLISLTNKYARRFAEGMLTSAGVKEFEIYHRDMSVLKGLTMPAFVLELSWDSTFYGDVKISEESGRNRAAEAIFDGIRNCINTE
jgi:N-acetylmuramoyl-L-alanine amidase